MVEVMITTTDNPYNPFVQFDEWKEFDETKGYFTSEYLARIAVVSEDLTEEEYNTAIEDAINEILKLNLNGKYKKVTKEDFE